MSSEKIIFHCAPTLAAIKTGSLFSCSYSSEQEIKSSIRHMNKIFLKKGLRILPLKYEHKRALLYIFRPDFLSRDLEDETANRLLTERGYCCSKPATCIRRLVERLAESNEFPHEIGLFLGYPPEDVDGFIQNNACCYKCVGYWKVYGDEEKAQSLFQQYQKCTETYCALHKKGIPMERLIVAAS